MKTTLVYVAFNFRHNWFRESTSFNKEHKFHYSAILKLVFTALLHQLRLASVYKRTLASTFWLNFEISLASLRCVWISTTFSEKIYQCSLVVLEAISLKLKCLVRNAPKTPMEMNFIVTWNSLNEFLLLMKEYRFDLLSLWRTNYWIARGKI